MGLFMRHLWTVLTSAEMFLGLLWGGLAVITVALLVLTWTRWGQSRPLRKCLVLSILAHLLLAGYATTVQICSSQSFSKGESFMRVSLAEPEPSSTDPASAAPAKKPWEQFPDEDLVRPELEQPQEEASPEPDVRPDAPAKEIGSFSESERPFKTTDEAAEPLAAPQAERREPVLLPIAPKILSEHRTEATPSPEPEREQPSGLPSVLLDPPTPSPRVADEVDARSKGQLASDAFDRPTATPQGEPSPAEAAPMPAPSVATTGEATATDAQKQTNPSGAGEPRLARRDAPTPQGGLPEIYSLRFSPDRQREAERRGATAETEAAVRAALKWLAANQEVDGRWDASRHGAGREMHIAGHDRRGAGVNADTGMTGLALLAFMAAGHTHQQGIYQNNVGKGLNYLMLSQRSDGFLAGEATPFAAMYCHAMAAFALSEAYAMTGDPRLERAVRRAISYTVSAQDPRGGGWRYTPNDQGDTSQLGWQLMALRSAELAGISAPPTTRDGALRFLGSVSSGRERGLAGYRPGQPATRSMTAEALYCRQLLGMPPESPTAIEAADYLLGELPGDGQINLYYWYYSTLSLYQTQSEQWNRWNEALQKTLLVRQRGSGELAGSWDPECVWGCYGGRIYSTALATLCLEVYYRYLPLNIETARRKTSVR